MDFFDSVLKARRTRVGEALQLTEEVVVIGAGEPIPLPEGTDQVYPFRAHAEFFYLAHTETTGAVLVFDPQEGAADGWRLFVPDVTEGERVWEGKAQPEGEPVAALESWLNMRRGRPIVALGAELRGVRADLARTVRARELLQHARRPKDATELALIRQAVAATTTAYAKIQPLLRAGVTERGLQIELEAEFFRGGGHRTGYGSIVGTGPNAAVLHLEPSQRAAKSGEFILIDAGAEVERYIADVTRTYVADGKPSAFQRDFFQVVLSAEEKAITRCVPGAEWREIHLQTAVDLVAGLVSLGIMRGKPESLVEQDAHTLFYPHGLGHMVGLGVRDGSGMLPGRVKSTRASLRTLRFDAPLEVGYVMTVEPGLYFIPALLNDPTRRERFKDCVNWDKVEPHLDLGGVRIEDNILITTSVPDVLTKEIGKKL